VKNSARMVVLVGCSTAIHLGLFWAHVVGAVTYSETSSFEWIDGQTSPGEDVSGKNETPASATPVDRGAEGKGLGTTSQRIGFLPPARATHDFIWTLSWYPFPIALLVSYAFQLWVITKTKRGIPIGGKAVFE